MSELSVLDLQNLSNLINSYDTTHSKMTDYAAQAEDPELRQIFRDTADSALKNRQELIRFLAAAHK